MLLGDRDRRVRGEARGRVQSMVHPEMKWIIECGINTANNLRSPPFRKKEKPERMERERGGRDRGKRKGVRERGRKSQLPSGGKSCY